MITLRPMGAGDIQDGLRLCRAAGWNQGTAEWKLFLELSPAACRVAINENGKVVGTVTTVSYQNHFSWIGMVLVDPDSQRQGIGMKLLNEALVVLNEKETVKLDATPAGRGVYLKLNFVDEYQLSRMQLNDSITLPVISHVQPITPHDVDQILAYDRLVFGADRKVLLDWMLSNAPHLAFCIKNGDQIAGYCFGRTGHNFTHIGPVVANGISEARDLVQAAIMNRGGAPVILDALHHTPEWITALAALGFTEQRPLIRMYRGANAHPGIPAQQFAILGPEFG